MVLSSGYSFLPQIQTIENFLLRRHTFSALNLKSCFTCPIPRTIPTWRNGFTLMDLTMTLGGSFLCVIYMDVRSWFLRLSCLDSGLGEIFFLVSQLSPLNQLGSYIWFSELIPLGRPAGCCPPASHDTEVSVTMLCRASLSLSSKRPGICIFNKPSTPKQILMM